MKFLIVKTSSIGDVIQTFPVVDVLKSKFPTCRIDWVVEKGIAPLLRAHPDIHNVFEVDTKRWRKSLFKSLGAIGSFKREIRRIRYDAIFDLQGNSKSGMINLFARGKKKVGYDWDSVAEKPNYLTTNVHFPCQNEGSVRFRYLQLVESHFGEKLPRLNKELVLQLSEQESALLERFSLFGVYRPRLMICFGSNWPNKQLSEHTLVEFLKLVQEKLSPEFIFVYGNQIEKEQADRFERVFTKTSITVGRMSLPLWQRFMSVVEGVIAMDSAALHLCGTTSTPSFSLFGPSSALAYKPSGDNHEAFQGKCPYGIEFTKRCPSLRTCKTGACLKDVSPQALFDQFSIFWSRVSKSTLASTK